MVSNLKYVSNQQHFLELNWLAILTIYIYIFLFCFDIKKFSVVFSVEKLVTGLIVRENDQIYEILG